ncbi:MAG: hypothetical protein AAGU75_18505, partial [Bacillota bacterium]
MSKRASAIALVKETAILERTVTSKRSSQSRYRIGNKIITVKSCFEGTKRMEEALYEIARCRMEKKQPSHTGLGLSQA